MAQLMVKAGGAAIPAIGFGTWSLKDEVAQTSVQRALEVGYRHIDTAVMYANEEAVGAGIRASGVPRDEIFITTKVPHEKLSARDFLPTAEGSIKRLGVSQVDLLLIHWPNPAIPLAEAIGELCKARKLGLARHIGVSNFTLPLLAEAVQLASEPLVANQCEYHPRLDQSRLIAACRRNSMAFVSYSPLARGRLDGLAPIINAARAHGRTENQIVLRWHVQQAGVVAIPRSSNPARIAENFGVFDFRLTDDEMIAISQLARADGRVVNPAWAPQWDPV